MRLFPFQMLSLPSLVRHEVVSKDIGDASLAGFARFLPNRLPGCLLATLGGYVGKQRSRTAEFVPAEVIVASPPTPDRTLTPGAPSELRRVERPYLWGYLSGSSFTGLVSQPRFL
jgi:hypothetical protein